MSIVYSFILTLKSVVSTTLICNILVTNKTTLDTLFTHSGICALLSLGMQVLFPKKIDSNSN